LTNRVADRKLSSTRVLAMTCRRCAARPQFLQVLGEAALSRMLPLRWSLSPP
jgi:hypothetical protein